MQPARVIGLALIPCLIAAGAQQTRLKPDKKIVFYPTLAQWLPDPQVWRAEIRGCVFEPEKRSGWTAALREALEIKNVEMTPAEASVFNERACLFLADHKRGKKIFVRCGNQIFAAGKSGADGRFAGEVCLHEAEWERLTPALSPLGGGEGEATGNNRLLARESPGHDCSQKFARPVELV